MICYKCGLEMGDAPTCPMCGAPQRLPQSERKKYPIIGLVGLLLILGGICGACSGFLSEDSPFFLVCGTLAFLVGCVILAAALFTGQVKLFG